MTEEEVTMEWLMDDSIQSGAGVSLARMTVAAGCTSELHHHTNCTETIHVMSGLIEQRIDDGWHQMGEGDTCLIPLGANHQTRNVGNDRAVMMIAHSEGSRIYVK